MLRALHHRVICPRILKMLLIVVFPGGDGPLQMPSNISFKALQAIIIMNHEKYKISKDIVDEFTAVSKERDEIADKSIGLALGRKIYIENNLYNLILDYHRTHPEL